MWKNSKVIFVYIPNANKITIFEESKKVIDMGGIGSGVAREGAGRKTIDGDPRTKISVTLPTWLLSMLRAEADRRNI